MVAVWGLRLAWHIRSRAVGEHGGQEDPRYAEMLGGSPSEVGMTTVVRRVFLVQGAVQWFIALPVMIGAVLSDLGGPLSVGTVGGYTATSNAASGKATMVTLVLASQ